MITPLSFVDKPLASPSPYLLFGEETQLLEEARAAIRRHFSAENIERADLDELPNSPLMRERGKGLFGGQAPTLTEIVGHTPPNREEQDALAQLVNNKSGKNESGKGEKSDDVLLVVLHNLEYRHLKAVWFDKIATRCTAVRARRQTNAEAIKWLRRWAAEVAVQLDDDAAEMLAMQTEGNLVPAKQALTKLSLAAEKGNAAAVRAALADGAQYDIFDLTNAILSGKGSRAVMIMRRLRAVGVADPLLVWSAANITAHLVSLRDGKPPRLRPAQLDDLRRLAERVDAKTLHLLLRRAAYADRVCKGVAAGDAEIALTQLIVGLAALRRNMNIKLPTYQP